MNSSPDHRMNVVAMTFDAPDARELASFYERLLGWRRVTDRPHYVGLQPDSGGPGLAFQTEPNFVRPVWPSKPGAQLMMSHLEIEVSDLVAATKRAIDVGAVLADHQPQDHVRVMIDPVGHPFCLFTRRTSRS